MPGEPENVDKDQQADPLAGTKYAGKSPAEIARMHAELESRLGEQGTELGTLRSVVADLQSRAAPEPTREEASKAEYGIYGDDLLVNPTDTVPRLARDIEDRAVKRAEEKITKRLEQQQNIEGYFARNPDLSNFREIVLTAADRLYRENPSTSVASTMEAAGRWARDQYLPSLRERLGTGKKIDQRKVAAITTSGGSAREGSEERVRDEEEEREVGDPGLLAINEEIGRLRKYREKKATPPRTRE